jgi:hypothetical protein
MIIDWSVEKITHELRKCNRAMHDKYATGFETWGCKQDLYRVKFILDEMLEEASTYTGEQEWLDEMEKEKVWRTLKKQNTQTR